MSYHFATNFWPQRETHSHPAILFYVICNLKLQRNRTNMFIYPETFASHSLFNYSLHAKHTSLGRRRMYRYLFLLNKFPDKIQCFAVLAESPKVPVDEMKLIQKIFQSLGKCEILPERLISPVIGVAGSSPAFVRSFSRLISQSNHLFRFMSS